MNLHEGLQQVLIRARQQLLSTQQADGYWWYTLEANETINAGTLFLMHFIEDVDPSLEKGLANQILSEQRIDGSWGIYFGAPGDLSATVECYIALKMAGHSPLSKPMALARKFILSRGGAEHSRIFTRIHLALFGLVPWSSCPSMPSWFMLLPSWCPINIYSFSSWARASIVPLLVVLDKKPVRPIPRFTIDEIFANPPETRDFSFPNPKGFFSVEFLFLLADKVFKILGGLKWHPGRKKALAACEKWIRDHIERTEDIFPAMAYAAYAMNILGYPKSDRTLQKAWTIGLKKFQQKHENKVYQQCCISPVWDTPWAGMAMLTAGEKPDAAPLLQSGRWLIQQQITNFHGDWAVKNKKGEPGGWAFEFQNDYFPDVDDTIEVLFFLQKLALPIEEKREAINRGLKWLFSMQSQNGGWAAFDKDNTQEWVNRIPFSDHGACLDPPTPDITGRMVELMVSFGYSRSHPAVSKAIHFLKKTQENWGPWWGRWGVNYLYGTWCVLQGLSAIGENFKQPYLLKAVNWLKSVQNEDGGWGESCAGYIDQRYIRLKESTPSQTAWALMGLIAAGEEKSNAVTQGVRFLISKQNENGSWDEPYFTGTGFPGHFYIRYHGYRQYFPTLAL
ncbi:MAG: squalene--hopene cyclase, partial [bacterium]|nr:squalene--hopene cyclase [bacterium]